MLSRINGDAWIDENGGEQIAWTQRHNVGDGDNEVGDGKDDLAIPCFKSMLDDEWYMGAAGVANASHHSFDVFRTHQDLKDVAFTANSASDAHNHDVVMMPQTNAVENEPFFTQKTSMASIFGADCSNPFEATGFGGLGCDAPLFSSALLAGGVGGGEGLIGFAGIGQIGSSNLSSGGGRLMPLPDNCSDLSSVAAPFNPMNSFDSFENSPFLNRAKLLRPLEIFPPVGAQPNLFQKRAAAALRHNSGSGGEKVGILGLWNADQSGQESRRKSVFQFQNEKRRKGSEDEGIDEGSIDASALNYDSDEDGGAENSMKAEESGQNGGGGNTSNVNSSMTGNGEQKGKKKGLPAKNLMAERRRRKKLNDRLYMLRSVVPKISKMDRASILGDAIEYLKELLQRINDLHNELESTPPSSALAGTTSSSFHPPLTPTPLTLPNRVKEELCPSSLPSPNNQPARVEVRVREGRAVNIHMFCARRPGLLLSTMRALDGLGLDIQQAVISCFNGFALDVFRAEQCKDGPGAIPEEIKAVLLHSAGFH